MTKVPTVLEYKYFTLRLIERKPKSNVYAVDPFQGDSIGTIKWYAPWHQYCFFPEVHTVFSRGCLLDLQRVIGILNLKHKKQEGDKT